VLRSSPLARENRRRMLQRTQRQAEQETATGEGCSSFCLAQHMPQGRRPTCEHENQRCIILPSPRTKPPDPRASFSLRPSRGAPLSQSTRRSRMSRPLLVLAAAARVDTSSELAATKVQRALRTLSAADNTRWEPFFRPVSALAPRQGRRRGEGEVARRGMTRLFALFSSPFWCSLARRASPLRPPCPSASASAFPLPGWQISRCSATATTVAPGAGQCQGETRGPHRRILEWPGSSVSAAQGSDASVLQLLDARRSRGTNIQTTRHNSAHPS
jgi:hypothetical protein